MRTLFGDALRRHAADPHAPAALASPAGEISYAELVERVERCASFLLREGCAASVPVGISVVDEIDGLVATLALLDLGVPQVTLSTAAPLPMRLSTAQRLAVGRVVVDDPRHALPGVATSILVPDRERDSHGVGSTALAWDPDVPAMFTSSSGTTGAPKLVPLSQRVIAWRARQLVNVHDLARDERVLVPLSTQEYPARSMRLYSLFHGSTVVTWPGASAMPASIPAYSRAMRVATMQLTVLQARALLAHADGHDRLPAETVVLLGASHMPAGLPAEFESRIGGRVYNRYGASEIGIVASMDPEGDDGTPDSVGRPVAGVDIEIVDGDGRSLPRGETGEIRLRCAGMIDRYHDDEVATAKHFRDGWFYPGDAGAITGTGTLRFLGRRDDMMSLNGINIFPAEIERVLEAHPSVKSAAAFPLRSPIHGDIPAAAVELHMPGSAEAAELVRYAREHLGARAPRKLVVMDALPRNAAGKVVKRLLAESFAART